MLIKSSDNSINVIHEALCDWDLTIAPNTDNNLDSGGVVTWLQDYDFYVSPANYHIQGLPYSSPEAYITLSPADPSLDRFDIIFVDADGIVKVREGEPSLTPSQPGLDLGLEVGLATIFVEAGSSSPVDIITECLTAWTPIGSDGDIDVASPSANCVDTSGLEATDADNGDYALFDRGTQFNPSLSFNIITFRLKPKNDWSNDPNRNHRLKIQFYLSGIPVGSAVFLADTAFNFSNSNFACQIISIPIIQFNFSPSTLADQLRITVLSDLGTFGFYMDGICLQGGIFGATESNDIHNQFFGPQDGPGYFWIANSGRAEGWFTSPQRVGTSDLFYTGSEKFGWASAATNAAASAFGYLAIADGNSSTAIGNQSYASGSNSTALGQASIAGATGTAVGQGSLANGGGSTALGGGAGAFANGATALGSSSNGGGANSIAIGYYAASLGFFSEAIGVGALSSHHFSMSLGPGAVTTAQHQVVWGGNDPYSDLGFNSMYFGTGVTSIFNTNRFWTITGSQGTDIPGDTWIHAGAKGTGNAPSGPFLWQTSDPTTSGSTLQSLSTKMGLNSNTLGFYLDNTRFQMDEGTDVVAATNLNLGTGNYFTITGNATINAISATNWQEGAVIYLLFTGNPTLKHNTAGGVGTLPLRLAGAVDFAATTNTVLALGLKDGYWREVGRTQSSAIGAYTFLNGLHEELGGLVKWGGVLVEDTTVTQANKYIRFRNGAGDTFLSDPLNQIYQFGDIGSVATGSAIGIDDAAQRFFFQSDSGRFLDLDHSIRTYLIGDIDGGGNGATFEINDTNQTQKVSNSSFQETEGADVIAANDLFVSGGNAFTVTGNTQVNAVGITNWQEGATIKLHLTGTPTLKHNTAGGANTASLRLAGAVDFAISGYTVLELQYKDSFWNEVGRTQAVGAGITGITANEGVTANTSTNVQLGSLTNVGVPFTTDRYINVGNNTLFMTGIDDDYLLQASTTNGNATVITGINSGGGQGVSGSGATGVGGFGTTTGVDGVSATGDGVRGIITGGSGAAGKFVNQQSSTNTVLPVARLYRTVSPGSGATGIGGSLEYYLETSDGNPNLSNQIISKLTDGTVGTRTSQLVITGVNSAVTADLFTLSGSGALKMNKYGVGSFTSGTATYLIATDASGNYFEYPAGGLVGGGIVTADNGLTINGANNVQLGAASLGASSPLLHNTYINTTSSYYLEVNGNNTDILTGSLKATNTGNGTALYVNTYGGANAATNAHTLRVEGFFTSDNTVESVVQILRTTGGTGGLSGMGGAIDFRVTNGVVGGNNPASLTNRIISKWTTAGSVSQVDITGPSSAIMSASSAGVVGIGISSGYTASRLEAVDNAATTGYLVKVTTTNTASAIFGSSTSSTAIVGQATTGVGGHFTNTSSTDAALQSYNNSSGKGGNFSSAPSSTNTIISVVAINRLSTGTAAAGIGAGLDFGVQTTVQNQLANQITSHWTTATDASRVSQLTIKGVNNAVTADLLTIAGSGSTQLNKYGVGTFTGTETYRLAVTSSGNIVEKTATQTKGLFVEWPSNTESVGIWQTPVAITVSSIKAVLVGSSSPSITMNIAFGTDRTSGTNVFTAGQTVTSTTTGHSFASGFNDATIPAGSFIWFTTSAQSGTVTQIEITVNYTED